MTTADETAEAERFARERREADARYNEALTALDRAVLAAAAQPALSRDDFARLATALIVFLQQITAFVDTKDRELAALVNERIDAFAHALQPLPELRQQLSIVQRAVQALSRSASGSPPALASAPPSSGATAPAPDDYKYVAFEDAFRGSDDTVASRLSAYVPLFEHAGGAPIVDLGCGRGELLALLKDSGLIGRGVDANGEMAAIARSRGLDATHGDALTFLESSADDALGGIVATQVVEHLEPAYLTRLLDVAARKLRSGAPIVLETINAACWLAFFSSYIRDLTHIRPVHPETLEYLLRASGFERVELRYSAPVPDAIKMKTFDLPVALRSGSDPTAVAMQGLAHAVNANAFILNSLMFTHLDYAAIGYRI